MRKNFLALLVLSLLTLAGQNNAVRAQSAAIARLSAIDAQGFPIVTALLDAYDEQGQPITGLEPEDVTLLENGQPFPLSGLSESTPPRRR